MIFFNFYFWCKTGSTSDLRKTFSQLAQPLIFSGHEAEITFTLNWILALLHHFIILPDILMVLREKSISPNCWHSSAAVKKISFPYFHSWHLAVKVFIREEESPFEEYSISTSLYSQQPFFFTNFLYVGSNPAAAQTFFFIFLPTPSIS